VLDVPLALAFAAGLVATVNPCGFAMLPAYLSLFVAGDGDGGERLRGHEAVLRGLRVGLAVSVGFLVVFGLAGIVLSAGAQAVVDAVPWIAIVVGMGLVVSGGYLLSGRQLPLHLPRAGRAGGGRGTSALVGFGIAYALASLSCTLPVFLTVVAGTVTRASLGGGLAMFGVYAVGMMLPLLAVSVLLALGRDAAVRRVRSFGRHADRIGGALALAAGLYIVAFWALSLSRADAPLLVQQVESLSAWLTNALGDRPLATGAVLAAVVAVAAAYGFLRRHAGGAAPAEEDRDGATARAPVPEGRRPRA
jgi:cytochrome c-type biogenesis protein